MDPYSLFDMFLTLFFLMLAVVILGSAGMAIECWMEKDTTVYDREVQNNYNKGVRL